MGTELCQIASCEIQCRQKEMLLHCLALKSFIPPLTQNDHLHVCFIVVPFLCGLQSMGQLISDVFPSQPQPLFILLLTHLPRDRISLGYRTQLEPSPTLSSLTPYMRTKCCATSFSVRVLAGSAGLFGRASAELQGAGWSRGRCIPDEGLL